MKHEKIHVIAVISNPVRFQSRYNLYRQFAEHMKQFPQVVLHTVETAFGHRDFEVTEHGNPDHLQLRTHDELWHKENMINLGIQRLPSNWKYVAWIDADIEFMSTAYHGPRNWAQETIEQLQHFQVVQLFQHALDLGPSGEVLATHKGFVHSYRSGLPFTRQYGGWHPGYAWAASREAINGMGGLIDFAILGSGDDHMAKGLIGRAADSLPDGIHPEYVKLVKAWQDRAMANVRRDIGFVPVTIRHFWHGQKKRRQYWSRWDILKRNKFDPTVDIKRDWQGLFQLTERSAALRDEIRQYFRQRNEDSNDAD